MKKREQPRLRDPKIQCYIADENDTHSPPRIIIAGGDKAKRLFFVVAAIDLGSFIAGATSVIISAATLPISVTNAVELTSVSFPQIFICVPFFVAQFTTRIVPTLAATTRQCPRNGTHYAAVSNGHVENFYQTGDVYRCVDVYSDENLPPTDELRFDLERLQREFGLGSKCFLTNVDGDFVSENRRGSRRSLTLDFAQFGIARGNRAAAYSIVGFVQQGQSFYRDGELMAVVTRSAFQNTVSNYGLGVTTTKNQTGDFLFGFFDDQDNGRLTEHFTLTEGSSVRTLRDLNTTASSSGDLQPRPSVIFALPIPSREDDFSLFNGYSLAGYAGSLGITLEELRMAPLVHSGFTFFVSSFASEETLIRKMTLAEIGAAIGGLLSGALVLMKLLFREEFVTGSDITHRVFVFRLQTRRNTLQAKHEASQFIGKSRAAMARVASPTRSHCTHSHYEGVGAERAELPEGVEITDVAPSDQK